MSSTSSSVASIGASTSYRTSSRSPCSDTRQIFSATSIVAREGASPKLVSTATEDASEVDRQVLQALHLRRRRRVHVDGQVEAGEVDGERGRGAGLAAAQGEGDGGASDESLCVDVDVDRHGRERGQLLRDTREPGALRGRRAVGGLLVVEQRAVVGGRDAADGCSAEVAGRAPERARERELLARVGLEQRPEVEPLPGGGLAEVELHPRLLRAGEPGEEREAQVERAPLDDQAERDAGAARDGEPEREPRGARARVDSAGGGNGDRLPLGGDRARDGDADAVDARGLHERGGHAVAVGGRRGHREQRYEQDEEQPAHRFQPPSAAGAATCAGGGAWTETGMPKS